MFYSSGTNVGFGEVSWLIYFILTFTYSQSTTMYTWDTLSCPRYYYDVMINNNDYWIGMWHCTQWNTLIDDDIVVGECPTYIPMPGLKGSSLITCP